MENINNVTQKLSTELYKQAGPQGSQGEPGQEGGGAGGDASGNAAEEGEVIDAEYEDVDSAKK